MEAADPWLAEFDDPELLIDCSVCEQIIPLVSADASGRCLTCQT